MKSRKVVRTQSVLSRVRVFAVLMAAGVAAVASAAPPVLHVDPRGSGTDGLSWQTAVKTPQLAFALAVSQHISTIKVVAMEFKTTGGTDRTQSFVIPVNVAVYGGYAGLTPGYPDPNEIIGTSGLSGEIGANVRTDNAYHVVRVQPGSDAARTRLERFYIQNGWADGGGEFANGAGIHIDRGGITLRNIDFWGTWATGKGGGIYAFKGNLDYGVDQTVISAGSAMNDCVSSNGGAIHLSSSDAVIQRVEFGKNGLQGKTDNGRDISAVGSPTKRVAVLACTFESHPGGPQPRVGHGGSIYVDLLTSQVAFELDGLPGLYGQMDYSRFDKGGATWGNGVWVEHGTARLARSIFRNGYISFDEEGNPIPSFGGGVGVSQYGKVFMANCLFEGCENPDNGAGSAIYVASNGVLQASNCVIAKTVASWEPGWFGIAPAIDIMAGATTSFNNCTIVKNETGAIRTLATTNIYNSIVWYNDVFDVAGPANIGYTDILGGNPGGGNISVDPCLYAPDSGYYEPKKGSPVIDAGKTSMMASDYVDLDRDGNFLELSPLDQRHIDWVEYPRIFNALVDMGAFEHQFCLADIDLDHDVDENDYFSFYSYWDIGDWRADMNCDEVVDDTDAAIFEEHYGAGC